MDLNWGQSESALGFESAGAGGARQKQNQRSRGDLDTTRKWACHFSEIIKDQTRYPFVFGSSMP